MKGLLHIALLLSMVPSAFADVPTNSVERVTVFVVVGAEGEPTYAPLFRDWATLWARTSEKSGAELKSFGSVAAESGTTNVLERLRAGFHSERKEGDAPLWVILVGHGTYDNKEARFNLAGPDLSATELAELLRPFSRPVAIVHTTSASGAFLKGLSATNRVIVTATRSGSEQNYARFGKYISEAIAGTAADLDHDGQTSLLEAYLKAAADLAEFYKTEGRLATEHPLLDDNGDGLGTPPDWFRGVRVVKKSKEGAPVDGVRAHQFHLVRNVQEQTLSPAVLAQRDELEQRIEALRLRKSALTEDEYFGQLENLLLPLARLYDGNVKTPAVSPEERDELNRAPDKESVGAPK